jgi:uncharacterized protein
MNSLEIVDRAYIKTSGSAKLTGENFSCNLAHVWTVKDEKIVRLEVYIDTDAMNAALVQT